MGYIDTDSFSKALRKRAIKLDSKKILIARLAGSDQEKRILLHLQIAGVMVVLVILDLIFTPTGQKIRCL